MGPAGLPSQVQMYNAAKTVCSLLDTKECGQTVTFKSDTTGEFFTMEPGFSGYAPPKQPEETDWWCTCETQRYIVGSLVFGSIAVGVTCLYVNLHLQQRSYEKSVLVAPNVTHGPTGESEGPT